MHVNEKVIEQTSSRDYDSIAMTTINNVALLTRRNGTHIANFTRTKSYIFPTIKRTISLHKYATQKISPTRKTNTSRKFDAIKKLRDIRHKLVLRLPICLLRNYKSISIKN